MDSSAQQTNVDAVTEWRERLPEVPPAVPEEEDPFGKALTRALLLGLALAVLGGAAYTVVALFSRVFDVWAQGLLKKPEAEGGTAFVSYLLFAIAIPVRIPLPLVSFMLIAGSVGHTYGRLTSRWASNRAATRLGVVVAGVGLGLAIFGFDFMAKKYGLLPPLRNDDFLFGFWRAIPILVCLALVLYARQPYRRKQCPRCGGLFLLERSLDLPSKTAERLAAAVRGEAPVDWPVLSDTTSEDAPLRPAFSFSLHRCDNCSARLLEGDIEVERGEPGKPYDVKWRWLSAVYSPEETAALEAGFPRRSLSDRLLRRR